MRIIQFRHEGAVRMGMVDGDRIVLCEGGAVYDHALRAMDSGISLAMQVERALTGTVLDYDALFASGVLLPPICHPDPAHLLVSGTGLTHLGSAQGRAKMHAGLSVDEELTDTMKMFRLGVEGGRPAEGAVGAQPEWFYKGDGAIIVSPGAAIPTPDFALDAGEEPELAGIYIIGRDGEPRRIGFAIGNEFSDHVTERGNYLWLAHSKLRFCAIGPELVLGDVPADLRGFSRIRRGDAIMWERPFLTGEANMSHSFANLEHHHFKYSQFRRPGDVHIHFMGTATLSFSDGVSIQPGDLFEISLEGFGRPLVNGIVRQRAEAPARALAL